MADLNKLFARLTTMGNISQRGLDDPEYAARIAMKHPEYGRKWANVLRRTMNDLGNSGAPLDTVLPGGATLKDMMRAGPMIAEMNEGISNTLRAGSSIDAAADVLAALGTNPIAGMDPTGHIWYAQNSAIGNLTGGNQPEILWRGNKGENSDREKSSYPPASSHNGSGRVNPTQNFVDAFPMANGLPIDAANSGYDPANPYAGRDPRLNNYVVVNGSTLAGKVVDTSVDDPNNVSGLNQDPNYRATRTGYYLRKHMNENVTIQTTGNANNAWHFTAFIRYTEIFLAYAEAANEAWGPKGTGTHGYSAYDVIKAIRARAGITGVQGSDAYLEECAADKAKMRELIRNERRIELSFEGHRFWDMRRWKLALDEPAMGVRIENGTYNYFEVDPRRYGSFQTYGPIPYTEVIKFSELVQNDGWK